MRAIGLLLLCLGAACRHDALGFGEAATPIDLGTSADPIDLATAPTPLDPPALPDVGDRCRGLALPTANPCGDIAACAIASDETLPTTIGVGDGPQIVLDHGRPLVFVATEYADEHGQLLRQQADGSWSVQVAATGLGGALARSAFGVARLDDDYAYGVTYYDELAAGWTGAALPGQYVALGNVLALDDTGCAYAALTMSEGDRLRVGRRADGWTFASPFGADAVERPAIALAADGSPELVGWRSGSVGWELAWVHMPGPVEAAQPSIGNVLGLQQMRFGVSGTAPHVLVEDDAGVSWVHLADAWQTEAIATSIGTISDTCAAAPTAPAQTCDKETRSVAPVAVIAGGAGALRLLWTDTDTEAHFTASCPFGSPPLAPGREAPDAPAQSPDAGGPAPQCTWQPASEVATSSLFVAAPAQAATAAPLPLEHALLGANAALGDDGAIHVVGYDGHAVRYVVLR